mmetsp:Transcript_14534/g.43114  ORF Transcript_14534/g.43114 Transcript_14534/m.43114 type:complete len:350 (-) Transcript_14534:163-1212(-)
MNPSSRRCASSSPSSSTDVSSAPPAGQASSTRATVCGERPAKRAAMPPASTWIASTVLTISGCGVLSKSAPPATSACPGWLLSPAPGEGGATADPSGVGQLEVERPLEVGEEAAEEVTDALLDRRDGEAAARTAYVICPTHDEVGPCHAGRAVGSSGATLAGADAAPPLPASTASRAGVSSAGGGREGRCLDPPRPAAAPSAAAAFRRPYSSSSSLASGTPTLALPPAGSGAMAAGGASCSGGGPCRTAAAAASSRVPHTAKSPCLPTDTLPCADGGRAPRSASFAPPPTPRLAGRALEGRSSSSPAGRARAAVPAGGLPAAGPCDGACLSDCERAGGGGLRRFGGGLP